jgi:UDP-N-acetylmuramate: L-alanyl-gamma-D-glutamyl-meso-diaminopimelate ligase
MTAFPFRKAHFIGLAGVGMSATAILLRDSGVVEAFGYPLTEVLSKSGGLPHFPCCLV